MRIQLVTLSIIAALGAASLANATDASSKDAAYLKGKTSRKAGITANDDWETPVAMKGRSANRMAIEKFSPNKGRGGTKMAIEKISPINLKTRH